MAGSTQDINIVAQAESGDALQQGEVIAPAEEHAAEGEHAAPADAAHGATDTHASTEAHAEVFPPFDPASFGGQLLWLAITFAALYFLMSRVALPRIGSILETRRTRIEGDLKEAERLRQETEKAAAAYEAALAEARKNAHGIAEETRAGIKADIDGRRADVEAGLSKRVAAAEARIQADKDAALANVDAASLPTRPRCWSPRSLAALTAAEATRRGCRGRRRSKRRCGASGSTPPPAPPFGRPSRSSSSSASSSTSASTRCIGKMLDDRIKKIETDLAEAEALRAEAKALLDDYSRRREEAEKEAETSSTAAREEAFRLTAEAKSSLEAMVARREKAVADKIAQAEAQAVSEVRARSADLAVAAARVLLEKQVATKGDVLVDQAIKDVAARLN
jgi:F-type H+-transporting ATPase subunit b